jgi:hypothetical protein
VASSCEHGNETPSFIKRREFFDELSHNKILEKDYALWNWLSVYCINCQE